MQLYSLMDRAVTSKSSDVRGFCLLSHATLAMLFTAQLELPISSAAAKFDEELWILDGGGVERLPPTWDCFPSNILSGRRTPTPRPEATSVYLVAKTSAVPHETLAVRLSEVEPGRGNRVPIYQGFAAGTSNTRFWSGSILPAK